LIGLVFLQSILFAQSNYSTETLHKIEEVENHVTGNLLMNDEQPGNIYERMEKYKVKGLSIAVIHDYKIAWAKGYGWADETERRPVTNETMFGAASISKALNALGILKLAQDGKVDLDTDINTYLTSWKFPYDSISKGKKITLAHLLSHTAGLSTFGYRSYNINAALPTLIDVLEGRSPAITSSRIQGGSLMFIPAVRSMFEPGIEFQYSGGGITISQVILTDVTHQSYESWMNTNILQPLGMTHSTYQQIPTKDQESLYASGYYRDGSRVLNKFHVSPQQAGGALWSTPTDIAQYVIDMQLAYKGNSSKVLSPEMVKLHLTPHNNGPTSMGSFIEDHGGPKYFQHAAGGDGFCGQFYASLDDGNGVVVFMNSEDGALLNEVINSVARAYNWQNFSTEPERKKSIPVSDSILNTYEGIYVFENSWAAIGKREGVYHYYTFGWQNYIYTNMYFTSTSRFFNEEFPSVKEFIKDQNGHVTGYSRTVDTVSYPNAVKIINPDTLRLSVSDFTDIGWYLFENKKYSESLRYFKRGMQLYPEDLNLCMSTAHAYLYNHDPKNAISIYQAHLKDSLVPGFTFRDLLVNDLIYLKEYRYEVKMFDRVFKLLKITKPKGY